MMKKQLNRMLQLANHTSGRSENSLLLTEDLIQFENRIEPARRATYNTYKKLQACLHGQQGSDLERRLKKMPLMTLSQSMGESCRELDNESSIRKMLEVCCYIEGTLAKVCVDHELQLEKDVLDPLFKLSEEELPNILKHKKKLDKLTLDWTSAKNRLGQATKSVNTGAMAQPTTAKVDLLKDEVDEIWRKVELSKDEYAADLYHFASKEEEYSNYFYLLLEAQAEYHRRSLNALDALLPTLKTSPNSPAVIPENPAYGRPLKEHLENRGQDIALPIEACVMMLLEKGMKEEGLFRLAAAASVLKRLKAALDGGSFDPEEFNSDSHAVAGALKSYLRELPQPLMTFDLYDEWFQAASEKDLPKQIERLREVSAKLPEEFYKNFRYLIKFLAKLAEYHAVNKMTPTNIAIVLGPNLLWPRNEGTVSMMNMASASSVQVVLVIEPVIQNADGIFPEDLDFSVSGMFGPSSLYSSYTSTKKDTGSTEPAQTTPPPLKEVTALKDESLCEERTLVRPSSPPPDVEEGPSKVEAPPNQTAPNQADLTSQTPNNLTKKVKKPVPSRPTFPPPHHPKASLPWTSKPMCAPLTQPIDERPIVRRATACPVRVPAVPPPPVPAPRTHQRTTSLGSAHFRLGDPPEAGGDGGKRPPEASVKTAPCQPRSPQVSWDTEPQPQPQSKPQATARVRVLSASQAMLAGTTPKVKGSLSVERSGPQEQSPDATTGGHL
ncbi:SH3 domain-binding protein 1-like [Leucoraja erinacea]|uniref:SH3 domain-binding protein 1-like n=1 Tax=Leucoraja erinaceus TaxID=7782 RepID=UPI002457A377|nr:SH3 domain-binding protein 1-like [Leucoraja erinacea]